MAYTDQIASRFREGLAYKEPTAIAMLTCSFLALLCVSLWAVSQDVSPAFHINYNSHYALMAGLSVAALTCFIPLFALSRFSFGYLISFYMFAITAGYLWLSYFTPLEYDHFVSRCSAATSLAAFVLPAILITKPKVKIPTVTISQMDVLAICLFGGSALLVAYGAHFGFHIVGIFHGEALRAQLTYPGWMNYAVSISSSALLPFAYAWFVLRKRYVLASLAVLVAITYYPITLNKLALLTPFWLLTLTGLLKTFKPRTVAILSLLAPLLLGFVAKAVDPSTPEIVFRVINFRMLSIPASGLDHYYHFFSTHPLTHFCQISIIGKEFACTLPDQLGVTMAKEYAVGNYNASLLASEGIASVGPYMAPVVALFCGLIIALGNLASAELKPSFVLLSSSVLAQALMNVPLSTTMLTHGGLLIFFLWLVTPRSTASVPRMPSMTNMQDR